MTMRIAILAACAGTLALAQPDIAWAGYGIVSESKRLVSNTDAGPVPTIIVAQNTPDPIPGIEILYGDRKYEKPNAGSRQTNKKVGTARKTLPKSKARRGFKISDNENPRPTDRIARKKSGNFDAGRRANRDGEAGPRTYFIGGATGGVWRR